MSELSSLPNLSAMTPGTIYEPSLLGFRYFVLPYAKRTGDPSDIAMSRVTRCCDELLAKGYLEYPNYEAFSLAWDHSIKLLFARIKAAPEVGANVLNG